MFAGRRMKSSFSKDWLSDPSTYPILGILGGACVFAASFIGWKFTNCKDVRVSSSTKGHVVRTW
jgi:hypothetical protein